MPVSDEAVQWEPDLAFPGLPEGGRLTRETKAPMRAKILSADGVTLAEGPAGGTQLSGRRGGRLDRGRRWRCPARRRQTTARAPTPAGSRRTRRWARVGSSARCSSRWRAAPAAPCRPGTGCWPAASRGPPARCARPSTRECRRRRSPRWPGASAGIAAVEPTTGRILALAGVAFSAPQPPGSVFKIVTTTAALDAGKVTPSKEFPVQTEAVIDGVPLSNAGGEACGGSFKDSFANSCNSVFAPLGVEVGAERLVETAERFGFNRGAHDRRGTGQHALRGRTRSRGRWTWARAPSARAACWPRPLQMASVGQTIANDGVRLAPTLLPSAAPRSPAA